MAENRKDWNNKETESLLKLFFVVGVEKKLIIFFLLERGKEKDRQSDRQTDR